MRRFAPSNPAGFRWACGGLQKRSMLEKYPRGNIDKVPPYPKAQKRKKCPFLEVPEILLALDAEDSPYVRSFTEEDAVQQERQWGYEPAIDEVVTEAHGLAMDIFKDHRNMRTVVSRRPNPFAISDHDVFSVALVGGSDVTSSLTGAKARNEVEQQRGTPLLHTHRALRANGIPERILAGGANKVIPFMLHRQEALLSSRESSSTDKANEVDFNAAVDRCKTLVELRRLCSHTPSLWHGNISQASMNHIAHALQAMPHQPLGEILKFVNNFIFNQFSKGAGLSASMSLLGLQTASKLGLLPSIIQHLRICLSKGFIGTAQDTSEMLMTVGYAILHALIRGEGRSRGTRPDLFTFLTGRSRTSSTLQPALFQSGDMLGGRDHAVYQLCLRLLGQLGAVRLLWHSWANHHVRAATQTRTDDEQVYVEAFSHCAQVLGSAASDTCLDYETLSGDFGQDVALDLQAINRLDAYHTSARDASPPKSAEFEALISSNEVAEAFKTANAHDAFGRYTSLISKLASCTSP